MTVRLNVSLYYQLEYFNQSNMAPFSISSGSEASSSQAVSEGSERSSPLREEQPVTPRQPEEFASHNASIPQCMPNYQLAFRQLDSDAIKHLNKHFVREISGTKIIIVLLSKQLEFPFMW